ncbi:phycobiliprotein lyase [cyanobiont of Ornithocercus magnificus]|nr:phycobiliprotein lyase [cyanobiont of Ornithocercus magnificus]
MKMNKTSSPITSFPPKDLAGFLDLCAGSWMSLRSHFELGNGDTGWHRSQHDYIDVKRIAESAERCLGGMTLKPPKGLEQELYLLADGHFNLKGAQQASGVWNFRSGNLELSICRNDGGLLTEWIYFAKPNLRLRSTMATAASGLPERASFASEIRRISRTDL